METPYSFQSGSHFLLNKELVSQSNYDQIGQELFQKAVKKANEGRYEKALEIASRAMFYARFAGHTLVLSLYSLQAWSYHELERDEEAIRQCRLALHHLKINQLQLNDKREYFIALMKHIAPREAVSLPNRNLRIAS